MMYSIKQKMKLLRELHNPEHADADLRLLREISPQNDLLRSPVVSTTRSAEKILYTLLDYTTAEKVRLNRRAAESKKQPENELQNENNEKSPDDADQRESDTTEQSKGNNTEHPEEDHPDGDTGKDDVVQQLNGEKKSKPVTTPENSKKKTSTRKSTGKTSLTKTSRSQR